LWLIFTFLITVAEVAKAFQRLTAAGTAPASHRIPFSDEFFNHEEHEVITKQHEEILSETWRFSLRSLWLNCHQPIRRKSRK
jgi:hypothetical protein